MPLAVAGDAGPVAATGGRAPAAGGARGHEEHHPALGSAGPHPAPGRRPGTGTRAARYPHWQTWLRENTPPALITWGRNDPFRPPQSDLLHPTGGEYLIAHRLQ